jgi:hypothetical protein
MDKNQIKEIKDKLNLLYDEKEQIDLQIDLLILKRNNLQSQIESGAAILIKYSDIL